MTMGMYKSSALRADTGIPKNYRQMPGFGVHTFKMINEAGKETYVKFHWKTQQVLIGIVSSITTNLSASCRSSSAACCTLGPNCAHQSRSRSPKTLLNLFHDASPKS